MKISLLSVRVYLIGIGLPVTHSKTSENGLTLVPVNEDTVQEAIDYLTPRLSVDGHTVNHIDVARYLAFKAGHQPYLDSKEHTHVNDISSKPLGSNAYPKGSSEILGTFSVVDRDELAGDCITAVVEGLGLSVESDSDVYDRIYTRVFDEITSRIVPLDHDPKRTISIVWDIDDVQSDDIRPDLNDEQAFEVLESVKRHHDASMGVNWDTLKNTADSVFPARPEYEVVDFGMNIVDETTDYPFSGSEIECNAWVKNNQSQREDGSNRYAIQERI